MVCIRQVPVQKIKTTGDIATWNLLRGLRFPDGRILDGQKGSQQNSGRELQEQQFSREGAGIIKAQKLRERVPLSWGSDLLRGALPSCCDYSETCPEAGSESTNETGDQSQLLLSDEGQGWGINIERNHWKTGRERPLLHSCRLPLLFLLAGPSRKPAGKEFPEPEPAPQSSAEKEMLAAGR